MAPHRWVWVHWWTVLRLSHTIQEVCQRFLISVLSLKDATVDSTGELPLTGGCVGQVTTLGEDLLSVGVRGLIHHADIIGTGEDGSGSNGDTLPTVHQGFSMIHSGGSRFSIRRVVENGHICPLSIKNPRDGRETVTGALD